MDQHPERLLSERGDALLFFQNFDFVGLNGRSGCLKVTKVYAKAALSEIPPTRRIVLRLIHGILLTRSDSGSGGEGIVGHCGDGGRVDGVLFGRLFDRGAVL